MSLLANAEFASIRAALEVTLTHTCTITPMVAGTEDAEGNIPLTPGTPVTNVPCTYDSSDKVVRDEGGATRASGPRLTVSATTVIAIGSRVTAVTDQLGTVLDAGPLRVERVVDLTAGLGAALLPTYELLGAAVTA